MLKTNELITKYGRDALEINKENNMFIYCKYGNKVI